MEASGSTVEAMNRPQDGVAFLRPEIQLLYKSKSLRDKVHQDFANALKAMDLAQKSWLKVVLEMVYKGSHPWLADL